MAVRQLCDLVNNTTDDPRIQLPIRSIIVVSPFLNKVSEKMKLSAFQLFLTLTTCFVFTNKAQQTSLKTTLNPKITTTLKPTTSKLNLTSTTTGKLTTTRKLNATTTAKINAMTTTKPATVPVFSLCRDTNSTASTGRIQLVKNTQTSASSPCTFDIIAPLGQQIQISCSVVSLDNYTSAITLIGSTESVGPQPVANRIYYSVENTLSFYSEFVATADGFDCNWNTTSKENTTKFNLCRHGQASTASGTVEPMAGNLSDPQRHCVFTIKAPSEYQINVSCSVLNFSSNYETKPLLQIDGTSARVFPGESVIINQAYYSTAQNEVSLTSKLGKYDWIDCKWTTARRENNKTNVKLCRDGETTAATGTITPSRDDKMPSVGCQFLIKAPSNQQIEISCSAINLTTFGSFLYIDGITKFGIIQPVVNETYYSTSVNNVFLSSHVFTSDWFSCSWKVTRRDESKTNFQLCRDEEAKVNGTITPLAAQSGQPSSCSFSIKALPDQQIQFSCSALNFVDPKFNSFSIYGLTENVYYPQNFALNRTYYSTPSNLVHLSSQIVNSTDWFNCKWYIVPKRITTNFKLCRDTETTSANGTLQPLVGKRGQRSCTFSISALPNQQIELSCSSVKLNFPTSSFIIGGMSGSFIIDEWIPVLRQKYYSIPGNPLFMMIYLSETDWFSCKWTSVPAFT